jgi:hypothetical protein
MPKKEKELSPVEKIWILYPRCKPSPEAIRKFVALGDELIV